MSGKTKIVVFKMKELVYTGIFIGLGIVLIIVLMYMFHDKSENTASVEGDSYVAGVYTSSLTLNNQEVQVEVAVDENHINGISLVNLDETVATMYPLMQPALDEISQQIYTSQSLDNITYSEDTQYTSQMLLDAIKKALQKAEKEESQKE